MTLESPELRNHEALVPACSICASRRTRRTHYANVRYDLNKFHSVGNDVVVSSLVSIVRPHLVSLGNHVAIDPWFHCATALETGDHIHISPHVTVIGGESGALIMGHFSNISAKGTIVCKSDTFDGTGLVTVPGIPEEFLNAFKSGPVVFEDFVNTGVNVTILPGITLREGTVIGACSLVTQSTEPWTVYVGHPARPIRRRPKHEIVRLAQQFGYR